MKNFDYAFKILELQIHILSLKLQQIKLKDYKHVKELNELDYQLYILMKSITKYDFISRINFGNSLLVGKGNLSFTVSLIKKLQQSPKCTMVN
ncbi:hypothetical protein [Rickettsia endosymbiont of Pantilius tunicatus]|uniref:hypothetical protein n=1 Tax=Rickettsia endosymbiont of Pantilius tunicatus TaxID=3066267 RepID=UPI00376F11C5